MRRSDQLPWRIVDVIGSPLFGACPQLVGSQRSQKRMSEPPDDFTATEVRSKVKAAMLQILRERGPDKTACPSTIAQEVSETKWDQLMPIVREVAQELAEKNQVAVTQNGESVDPVSATGPIRIGIVHSEGPTRE